MTDKRLFICEKCGEDKISVQYKHGGNRPGSEWDVEHLTCKCTRCGYVWNTDVNTKQAP